ncbi:hypothetical protein [Streptomyces sp. NPDC058739]|uniref:hypothetical protein n=1 Tax=Streptomyces sp. NPDC058739 TaxID=3346618 RepID=UPI00367BE09B
MKYRYIAAVAIAGTVSVGVVATGPASAAAGTRTCIPYFHAPKGDVCFDADGDKFVISDMVSDGRRLVVKWTAFDGSGRSGECHDADGANNGVTVCNYDFVEGRDHYVKFQGMTRNGARGTDADKSPALNGPISPR